MNPTADLYTPCAPGSLMRSRSVRAAGRWRLARRDCELYSVQIVSAGAWARAQLLDGRGRALWYQPSTFTGSFWLSGAGADGLLLELHCTDAGAPPNLTINWREPDQEMR